MAPNPAQFPSIAHPLSRLGSRDCLSISGRSREGAQSVDWSFGAPSPQPTERAHSVAGLNPGRASNAVASRSSTSLDGRRISTDEVLQVLEEKVRSGNFHSVKKLFRSNDPSGEGNVTKEAFSRILWQLCGYLSPRQISHVLRRLGLDKSNAITFEDLVCYFRRPASHGGATEPMVKQSFLKPPNSAPDRFGNGTPRSRMGQFSQYTSPQGAADASWEALKSAARTGQLDFQVLFPPMCFGEGAYVIPGQLRECLQKLGIPASDDIVANILRKLDGGSPYAIHTNRLFNLLGLNADGKLPSKPPSGALARREEPSRPTESPAKTPLVAASHTPRSRPKTSLSNEPLSSRPPTCLGVAAVRPRTSMDVSGRIFDGDVADFVSKKLEEGQAHVIRALETKDTNSSGLISKPDLRDVFKILGFNIKATNLEHFLSRNGLRRNDGVVNYRLLLRRIQTRSGRGMLNRVMRSQDHVFHDSTPPPTPSDGTTASLLETKLLDIFQREFLALLAAFRQLDPSGTGLLTLNELKSALEGRFSIKITDSSWEQFVSSSYVRLVQPPSNATQGEIGYVPYNDFLAKFDVMLRPATVDADDPWVEEEADMSRLKEHKDRYLKSMGADPADHTHRHEPRPLEQLEVTLVDVFLYKFHNFKKEYDLIVREDHCRVDKEKFDYILFRCGFVLTPSELSHLWLSMPITRPMESLSMPTILQHVMRLYYSALKPAKFSKSSRDSTIVTTVLEKIREPIVTHWNLLKKKLRYLDPMGTSRIAKEEMHQILRGLRLNITDMELHYLVEMLESRIPGKTNYFRLMEYFAKNPKHKRSRERNDIAPLLSSDSARVYPKVYGGRQRVLQHDYRYPTPPKPDFITLRNAPATPPFKRVNVQPGVMKSNRRKYPMTQSKGERESGNNKFYEYRGKFDALIHHTPSTRESALSHGTKDSLVHDKVKPHIGARDLPFLGRALRKEDKAECGRISVEAFRKIMASYGVQFKDPNEIYKLLSRYDRKMRDGISYEKFLKVIA